MIRPAQQFAHGRKKRPDSGRAVTSFIPFRVSPMALHLNYINKHFPFNNSKFESHFEFKLCSDRRNDKLKSSLFLSPGLFFPIVDSNLE